MKLEELLVEESWLEALPGELQKPYAVNLSKFVETEICGGDVYPPPHLIFNALNSTPFHHVKAVILGQVCAFRFRYPFLFCYTAFDLGVFDRTLIMDLVKQWVFHSLSLRESRFLPVW